MAAPRVFVSSTCFDLGEIRDGLLAFLENLGLEVALSERGDVFYHPDLHTHESCIVETGSCHLFVLIIGGRFGGQYLADRKKSITNAEYSAARMANIPTFTFIKQDVLNDHNLWTKNRSQDFAVKIVYPSIERQEHAADIFEFIDEVRKSEINNGVFGFRYGREVEGFLRKQLAGLLFDHLQKRTLAKQIAKNSEVVGSLSIVSAKIEELVKDIYRKVDGVAAEKRISAIDLVGEAETFFAALGAKCQDSLFLSQHDTDRVVEASDKEWAALLCNCAFFDVELEDEIPSRLLYSIGSQILICKLQDRSTSQQGEYDALQLGYEAFRELSHEDRRRIVKKVTYLPDVPLENVSFPRRRKQASKRS